MNSFLSPRLMAGAAIVGLVGAAGVFIYEQIYAEKHRAMLVKEVANLDKQVSSMRVELESLRELQKENQLRREKHKKRLERRRLKEKALKCSGDAVDGQSDSEYFTDYASVVGTEAEMDSEEFYDVHTDEDSDDTLRDSVTDLRLNGQPRIDNTLDLDREDSPKPNKNET